MLLLEKVNFQTKFEVDEVEECPTLMEFVPGISTFKRERSLPVVFGFECWTRNSNHQKKSAVDGKGHRHARGRQDTEDKYR